MLDLNIIRRSNSPYINPVKVVIKKDNSLRICLDSKRLNEKLIDDFEALPGVDELFPRCKDVKYITSLDLTASYWQIPLEEESKKYTAFKCDNHVYEFNVVAFGIKTSGAAVLRSLHQIIGDIDEFALAFVDDLAVISKNFDQHLKQLQILFNKLQKHNLRLNFNKSNLAQSEITFLGHVLSAGGLKPDPEKIAKIKNFAIPKNIKQLQAFLGFVNFYTKYVKNYSHLAFPLMDLLKKDVPYQWTSTHNDAFNEIKNKFDETVILKFPNIHKPYILTTDASDYAIAAILSQRNNENEEEIITFVSRILKASEFNYFATEKEMLAIIWSFNKLRTYLKGACNSILHA